MKNQRTRLTNALRLLKFVVCIGSTSHANFTDLSHNLPQNELADVEGKYSGQRIGQNQRSLEQYPDTPTNGRTRRFLQTEGTSGMKLLGPTPLENVYDSDQTSSYAEIHVEEMFSASSHASTSGTEGALSDMIQNRATWSITKLSDYDYIYERQCFCTKQWRGPFIIQVRNGKVVSASYHDPSIFSGSRGQSSLHLNANRIKLFKLPTVKGLFDIVDTALVGKPANQAVEESLEEPFDRFPAFQTIVTYDDELGYPKIIQIDSDEYTSDDETIHLARSVVQPGVGRAVKSGLVVMGCFPSIELNTLPGYKNTFEHAEWSWRDSQWECAKLCNDQYNLDLSWVMDYGFGEKNAPHCRCADGEGFLSTKLDFANNCGDCDVAIMGQSTFFDTKACLMRHVGDMAVASDFDPPRLPPTAKPSPLPTLSPSKNPTKVPVTDPYWKLSPSETAAFLVFDAMKEKIDSEIFLSLNPARKWVESSIYRYDGFLEGLKVMVESGIDGKKFYLGESNSDSDVLYGLANVAAFLAQSMKETIMYDSCDENNWDLVNGNYPLSNACGQLEQSYQHYECPVGEKHMTCEVDPDMKLTAVTHAKWYGAPAPLFCGPKHEDYGQYTGYWDYTKECNDPWGKPPRTCTDYKGQQGGGFEGGVPWENRLGRTDVEGCCWWGRGVIQTTGPCNFGRLNYYLGKRAFDEGRESRYPEIDFCKDPESICSSEIYPELKWIAGFFYWIDQVQEYNAGDWNYMERLKGFVDSNMMDHSFITSVSGIVNRGCHNPPCITGMIDGEYERRTNFNKVLDLFLSDPSLLKLVYKEGHLSATDPTILMNKYAAMSYSTTAISVTTTDATIQLDHLVNHDPPTSTTTTTTTTTTSSTTTTATATLEVRDYRFYPSWPDTTCYDDGLQPPLHVGSIAPKDTLEECCNSYFFSWQVKECLNPQSSGQLFYPNYFSGTCKNDEDYPLWMVGKYFQITKVHCCLIFFPESSEECKNL